MADWNELLTQLDRTRDLRDIVGGGEWLGHFDAEPVILGSDADLDRDLAGLDDDDLGAALDRMARYKTSPSGSFRDQGIHSRMRARQQGARKVLGAAEVMAGRQALRPNQYTPIVSGTVPAATANVQLTIQPGGGIGNWQFHGFHFEDVASQFFVITALTIAGLPVIQGTVATTGNALVAQGFSVGVFDTRNPDAFNLTPWMGKTFQNNQPIVMTIANVSNAGDVGGGAYTLKGAVLTSSNPCDVELPGANLAISQAQTRSAMGRGLGMYRGGRAYGQSR
jgi:hypothetical protein